VNPERPQRAGRPWVMTKFVVCPDGSEASDGRVGALSEPLDQHLFGLLRSIEAVIVVGAATLRLPAEGYGPHNPCSGQRCARVGRASRPWAPPAVETASGDLRPGSALFASPEQTTVRGGRVGLGHDSGLPELLATQAGLDRPGLVGNTVAGGRV
jgi:hypothetical protein